jgi:hypothetical protein
MFSEWELRRGINLAKSFDLPDCETLRAFAALAIPMHGFLAGDADRDPAENSIAVVPRRAASRCREKSD